MIESYSLKLSKYPGKCMKITQIITNIKILFTKYLENSFVQILLEMGPTMSILIL